MDNLNLVVKFMLAADGLVQVKGAARIKVDGRGALHLYDAQGGSVETIELGALQSLRLHPVRRTHAASAPALA
jgi:hypothetical protein